MNLVIKLSFLFLIGAVSGWVIELFFRRFISASNPERKWINPGFCVGPYLPLYGFGLCIMYMTVSLEDLHIIANPAWNKLLLLLIMAAGMTAIEYIAGIISLKLYHVRLWDYSGMWGNIQGIICPAFSLIWALLGAVYYFLLHPRLAEAVEWLLDNLEFSFVLGLFFGIFLVDVVYSLQLVGKIKQFAADNNVIVRYENLKAHIRAVQDKNDKKYNFLFPFRSDRPLAEHLKDMKASLEKRVKEARQK